jgi:repressor LexA
MSRDKILKAKKAGKGITPAQKDYLQVIRDHVEKHGYPPTYRDISELMLTSLNAVAEMVTRLERDGYVA